MILYNLNSLFEFSARFPEDEKLQIYSADAKTYVEIQLSVETKNKIALVRQQITALLNQDIKIVGEVSGKFEKQLVMVLQNPSLTEKYVPIDISVEDREAYRK